MFRFQRACIWNQLKNESRFAVVLTVNQPTFSPYIYSTKKSTRQYSTAQNVPCEIPMSQLESKTHPLGWEQIQAQVEPYFGNNWSFASEKEKKGFLSVGLSRAFSHSFPLTLDDRIDVTCKMLYLSLLIDGESLGWQ
jgi:aristolochene synthase